jgi:hypothetical protein
MLIDTLMVPKGSDAVERWGKIIDRPFSVRILSEAAQSGERKTRDVGTRGTRPEVGPSCAHDSCVSRRTQRRAKKHLVFGIEGGANRFLSRPRDGTRAGRHSGRGLPGMIDNVSNLPATRCCDRVAPSCRQLGALPDLGPDHRSRLSNGGRQPRTTHPGALGLMRARRTEQAETAR